MGKGGDKTSPKGRYPDSHSKFRTEGENKMGGFQTRVQNFPAPGVEGDFASANPRSTYLAGPGGLVCGPVGVFVGRFAWVEPDMVTANNFGSAPNAPDGFVHRDQQGLLTQYLEVASLLVPAGFPITLHNGGDFWARNLGPAALTKGATVYAGYADGGIYSLRSRGRQCDRNFGLHEYRKFGRHIHGCGKRGFQ